ncbi:MAG: histidine--tRNA ligase [Halobacteria archaeon]
MDYESLKGFRDFYPREMRSRQRVFSEIAETARRHGFREIGTPALEPLELFEVKSGAEIVEETYSFQDKGGRDVTLVPELTPSVVRMFVAKKQELSKPVRWFSMPRLWRYEQPQSGRLREFFQPNFDIFGVSGIEADAEVIAFAHKVLSNLGLEDDYVFRVSHRDVIQGVVGEFDVTESQEDEIYRVVDKSERLDHSELRKRLEESGLSIEEAEQLISVTERKGGTDELDTLRYNTGSELAHEGLEELRKLWDVLDDYGVSDVCIFDPSIVRGFDYYTGTVFECFDPDGDLRAIFGGGRYDDLVETFGGQSTPAVGFGIGDATLELLMKQSDVWPAEEHRTDYYVAVIGDVRDTAIVVADSLRDDGYVVEMDVTSRGFSGQLERADRMNAENTVIVGERDLADGVVTVKDMESGDQEQVPVEEFVG